MSSSQQADKAVTALRDATHQQRRAADPQHTRLVSANAGSGKTRVLVNRVSRLLLADVPPSDILCLTYTKAAAAEMQDRLFKTLGAWSVMEEDRLADVLSELFGQSHDTLSPPIDLALARQLFAKALETPEGLKVQTIHAFCERLLARFPIEAGIMPGFDPMDDAQQRDLKSDIRLELIQMAATPNHAELFAAMQVLTVARADQTLEDLFGWMASSPEKIRLWEASGGTQALAEFLSIEGGTSELQIIEQTWESISQDTAMLLAEALSKSPASTDQKASASLKDLDWKGEAGANLAILNSLFFTKDGKPRARFYTAKAPDVAKAIMEDWADIIIDGENKRRSAKTLELTDAVFQVAQHYRALYAKRKHELRALDFSDQILLIRNLLMDSEAADWVRYKLDGGIEHILVDEAQDTSPEQWQIIDALAAPFFQPDPDRDPSKPRTLFAVGDEKQSIYSFQGADPQQFLDKIQIYSDAAEDPSERVRMRMSFRSTPQVLDVVDNILIEGGAMQSMFPDDYPPGSDIVRHIARRDDAGCVELWPIVKRPEHNEDKAPWDTTPVDALSETHQRVRLAKHIAQTIKSWIDRRQTIYDHKEGQARPINAGDILILVQRRNSFFDAIIQQLKKTGIPVAGADRLKLNDAIIVKDMLSLARFALLPSDDLSLAEVLKSPLIGFDDEALFEVARARGDISLWESLQSRRPDVACLLGDIVNDGQHCLPYDFFMRMLERTDRQGRSFRERFFRRLSMEAQDALDAFLSIALDHQYHHTPDLHHFVKDFSENDADIKRDLDMAHGQVRVMTVHGAKGLEAPIVFLPDTTSVQTRSGQLLEFKEGYVWSASKAERPAALEPFVEAAKEKTLQEQLRLFYVAMTRAETRLIVCGFDNGQSKEGYQDINKKGEGSKSWYAYVKEAFERLPHQAFDLPFETDAPALRYGKLTPHLSKAVTPSALPIADVPDWAREPFTPEVQKIIKSPSRLMDDQITAISPKAFLTSETSKRKNGMRRGTIIHKLLEMLPDYPSAARSDIADKFLASYGWLSADERRVIKDEAMAVLSHPDFADLFAADSRGEVSVSGSAKTLPKGLWLNGQIDRLCVGETQVLIVDYKSDAAPPDTIEDVSGNYLMQLAAYRALIAEIYPNHDVACALLWTALPKIMPVPSHKLDEALQMIDAPLKF